MVRCCSKRSGLDPTPYRRIICFRTDTKRFRAVQRDFRAEQRSRASHGMPTATVLSPAAKPVTGRYTTTTLLPDRGRRCPARCHSPDHLAYCRAPRFHQPRVQFAVRSVHPAPVTSVPCDHSTTLASSVFMATMAAFPPTRIITSSRTPCCGPTHWRG